MSRETPWCCPICKRWLPEDENPAVCPWCQADLTLFDPRPGPR